MSFEELCGRYHFWLVIIFSGKMANKENYFVSIILTNKPKAILLILHFIIWLLIYRPSSLGWETMLTSIPAILTGDKVHLKFRMIVLAILAAFLATFLYDGSYDTNIAEIKMWDTTAIEAAWGQQDVAAIECGFNSSKNFEFGVLQSCCTTPSCHEGDILKLGCTEALDNWL